MPSNKSPLAGEIVLSRQGGSVLLSIELDSEIHGDFGEFGVAAEKCAAVFNFAGFEVADTIEGKIFYGKACHGCSGDDCLPECILVEMLRSGKVSDKSACECVAGPGRIFNHFKGESGGGEEIIAAEHEAPMLALFDDDAADAEVHDFFCGFLKTDAAAELTSLRIIKQNDITTFENFGQLIFLTADPIVHGVCHNKLWACHLLEDLKLKDRVEIAKHDEGGVFLRVRNFWGEGCECV